MIPSGKNESLEAFNHFYAETRGRSNLQLDSRNVGSGKRFTHQVPKRIIRIEGSVDHTTLPEPSS